MWRVRMIPEDTQVPFISVGHDVSLQKGRIYVLPRRAAQRLVGCGMWVVGCRLWDVTGGMWVVRCGLQVYTQSDMIFSVTIDPGVTRSCRPLNASMRRYTCDAAITSLRN